MEVHNLGSHQHILNGSFAVHCHTTDHGTWIWPFSFLPVFIAAFCVGGSTALCAGFITEVKQHWPQLVYGWVTFPPFPH